MAQIDRIEAGLLRRLVVMEIAVGIPVMPIVRREREHCYPCQVNPSINKIKASL